MNNVMAFLFRFAIIIGGYIAASLAASAFLNVVILGSAGFTADEMPVIASGSFVVSIPLVALLIAYYAFFPSMLAILAGETVGKRDWLFYALAGAVVACVLVGIDRSAETGSGVPFDLTVGLVMIATGMCGGIGYWLIAGRSAGSWRRPRRDVTSSEP